MKEFSEKNLGEGFFNLKKRRKLFSNVILILLICFITLGVSYAYWKITHQQRDFNTLGVSCFEVTLTNEENDIRLENASPITDEEGNGLTPYTFTITNTCDTYAHYEVNLEDIYSSDTEKRLSYQYIKASLDGGTPQNLKNFQEVEPTLPNADRSFKLTSGTLAPTGSEGDQKTYELRLWMDYDTPPLPETMNAIFRSKISIVASYVEEETLQNNIVLSYESKTEGYSKVSETVEIQATSENYNIIEISEDGVTFTPVSPSKEIRITKEYTKESNPIFYVRDEVGNIEKIDILLEHLDQSGPEIIATPQEEWGTTNTISIELKDEKSGLSGYQITMTEEEPSEWKEVSGNTTTVEEVVNENKTYYIWSKDVLGNIHHQEVTVSKIDTNAPISSFTTNVTGGSVSIDAGASTDGETKIVKYEYKLDDGNYYPSETSSYTFTGVSHGTHTISVRVTDEAGNQHETSQNVEVVILFTISYNANGGSGAPSSQTKTYGVNLTLSSTRPTRTGYTFLGWSTSSTATSATYSAGGTFDLNADTTLYAVWKINTYTISYNANGGSGAPSSQTKTYGVNLTLSSTRPTRTGYTFLGWSTSSSATSATYSAGGTFTSNANTTLYAVWKLQYAYISGNQLTEVTGGWTYTRTWTPSVSGQYAADVATFTNSYIQWAETDAWSDAYADAGHGGGYFQHTRLINLNGAKTINFQYTISQYNGSRYGAYYPRVTFQILNSSGAVVSTQTLTVTGNQSSIQTISLNTSSLNMSSIRIRVTCSTLSYGDNAMVFRLYNVYATY